MLRTLRILSLLLAVAFAACSRTTTDEAQIKVISYNIRYQGEPTTDGEHFWPYRRHASINMVQEERPTVMGVQEALEPQLQFLAENLPEYGHVGVGRDDGVSAGEFMAIFYRKDEVELEDWGTFWLSATPDEPSRGWDAACHRTCTWAIMQHKASGKRFAALNTHLDHRGAEAQANGLRLIAQRIGELVPTEMPIVLTGDFNSTTDNAIYKSLEGLLSDSRELATETDRRSTFNAWGKGEAVIDHIFVRGVQAERFEVLCDKNYGAPYISDHYPVATTMKF